MTNNIISFPHLGNYSIPIYYFLSHVTKNPIKIAPPITKKTLELGSKYSPDFVCLPFKYNLGNFIESLEEGASILLQAGGGCRYGYYGEVQCQILKDLGYDFKFVSFLDDAKLNPKTIYKALKSINPKLSKIRYLYYLTTTMFMINCLDKIENYIRLNIGFEVKSQSFKNLEKRMLSDFKKSKGIISILKKYRKYKKLFKSLPINKPKNCLKIGVIGELYTSMEQFSSYFIEENLAKYNIEIKRYTNLTYLLIKKQFNLKKLLKKARNYATYELGADGLDNVARTIDLIEKKYDGIVHIKPFGCTPEIGAIPIINKICKQNKMPIIYFSFDSQTSDEGIKTRLEALADMLKERRKK